MGKVILIVEDDPKSLKLAKDLLNMSGYSTIQASDGAQGVELAKAQKPDLVLMDIMMPKMDGYTACHAIKSDAATKNIPVIMVTALGFELNKQLAERMGASGYITKPIDRQELVKTIGTFLGTS
jgi:twitching motility two-component system response regulator PilH